MDKKQLIHFMNNLETEAKELHSMIETWRHSSITAPESKENNLSWTRDFQRYLREICDFRDVAYHIGKSLEILKESITSREV